MIFIKYLSLIYLLLNTIVVFSLSDNGSYKKTELIQSYNFELIGKFGVRNKRHIGQAGILLPIFSSHNKLLYSPVFTMLDNKNSKELNVGLGFRKMLDQKYIHGGYAFLDYRKSPRGNFFKQLTFGYEFFTDHFEARANVYIPENKLGNLFVPIKDKVETNYNGNITTFNVDRTNNLYTEKASRGFDIEFGLTKCSLASIHLGYYSFFNQENQTNGMRTRGNLRVLPWLTLEAEINYDNNREITPYLGLKINMPFIKKHQKSIYTKMTYLPIRDIDIITSVKFIPNVHTYFDKIVVGWAPMVDRNDISGNSNVYFDMIQVNTHCTSSGQKYADIGTILANQLFTLMGEFEGGDFFVAPGTNEFSILINIRNSLVNHKNKLDDATPNSPLLDTFKKGFWTMKVEFEENLAVIREIEKKYKTKFSQEQLNYALNNGISGGVAFFALKWEFRNREDIFVAFFDGEIDHTAYPYNLSNIRDSSLKLEESLENYKNERFILINLYQKNHTVGVKIDNHKREIVVMESNRIPANGTQIDVLHSKFPGYTIKNYTPVRQAEDWSCAAHAFINMVGIIKGSFTLDTPFSYNNHRHIGSIYKRMILENEAFMRHN